MNDERIQMINLIEVFKESSLCDVLVNNMDLSYGARNVIVFGNKELRNEIFEFILKRFRCSELYVMSGFNLSPYLNLVDNVYVKLMIDLSLNSRKNRLFEYYCNILEFENIGIDFHMLSDLDKLKSMIITSLLSNSKVLVFDSIYSFELMSSVYGLLDNINGCGLFSNRIFIELKEQVTF